MKKITKILIPTLLAAASFSVPAAGTEDLFGNIVFIGDSITQANGTNAVSYRYQLWKCFVDSGVAYNPVGSMTHYLSGNETSSLISSYNYFGSTFDNTNEGHFSWNSGWLTKPGNINTNYAAANSFPTKTVDRTKSLADYINTYYSDVPDTASLLMGINDLARNGTVEYSITQNLSAIVSTLQSKNANITIHVYSLLPNAKTAAEWKTNNGYTGTTEPWALTQEFNAELKKTVESGAWNTATSTVVYHDITAGIDATSGVHTYDGVHPNAQGELIIAGNMARALGIGQRTVGLERKGGENLSGQVNFSGGNATVTLAGTTKSLSFSGNADFVSQSGGNVIFSSDLAGTSIFSLAIDDSASTARDVTVSLTLQMSEIDAAAHTTDNIFGITLGNGADLAGTLYIGESGIFWGGTDATNLLYGCTVDAYKTKFMVDEAQSLRIVYLAATDDRTANGVAAGYYVWLGDQLIGEALSGTADAANATELLLGDLLAETQTSATLSALSLELGAFAPSAIPEPSLFGLFAGTLALALAGTRRRRNRRGNGF